MSIEITPEILTRFWSKVKKTDNCWIWKGAKMAEGYGHFRFNNKDISAHRLSYELSVGEIPKGKELDHLCRNKACVRLEHLELVTHKENIRRGLTGLVSGAQHKARTHCPQGHEYSEENTYVNPNGKRQCKICRRERYVKVPKKTHCKRGHEFTEENTYIRTDAGRRCRICESERHRKYYQEKIRVFKYSRL